jgi:hypothetical protein
VIDPAHWDGLPDGHTRATTLETSSPPAAVDQNPLAALLATHHAAGTRVARRPLTDYTAAVLDGGPAEWS